MATATNTVIDANALKVIIRRYIDDIWALEGQHQEQLVSEKTLSSVVEESLNLASQLLMAPNARLAGSCKNFIAFVNRGLAELDLRYKTATDQQRNVFTPFTLLMYSTADQLGKVLDQTAGVDTMAKPEAGTEAAINPGIRARLHSDISISDQDDVLQYDIIAENLFSILTDQATTPPLNIGILAPWGKGKTSLMKKIKAKFDEERASLLDTGGKEKFVLTSTKFITQWCKGKDEPIKPNLPYPTVWFNPWNYQSSDMLWAGMADAVINQVVEQIPTKAEREMFWLQLRFARLDRDKLRRELQTRAVLFVGQFFFWIIFVLLAVSYWLISTKGLLLVGAGISAFAGAIVSINSFLKPYKKKVTEIFDQYTKQPSYTEKTGAFHEVQMDLERIFKLCIQHDRPLVIFVDDLDRCSNSKVVEVIEAINVFINGKFNSECYFVLGMDAEMVAASLDVTYEKMKGRLISKENEQGSIGWYFMDKFIQLPFFIPVLSESKKTAYLKSLLNEKEFFDTTPATDVNLKKVKDTMQAALATGDNRKSSDIIAAADLSMTEKKEGVKMLLKNQVKSPEQSRLIMEQADLYAPYLSSDPRSLKRFVNLLRFYCGYQFARMKFGEKYVEVDILARWLALMMRFPRMIRWIQWDSENKSGTSITAEEKVQLLDALVAQFNTASAGNNTLQHWQKYKVSGGLIFNGNETDIETCDELPWLRSPHFFNIVVKNFDPKYRFANALECNIW